MNIKTFSAKSETVQHNWLWVDATDKVLGRLASEIAKRLRGKHKPEYTPHVDTGDYIIVVNADKICVTGNKEEDKNYYRHSGYPGGLKKTVYRDMKKNYPERIIEKAIKGMLPRNALGRDMLRKLKVYAGENHPHSAQQPQPLEISR